MGTHEPATWDTWACHVGHMGMTLQRYVVAGAQTLPVCLSKIISDRRGKLTKSCDRWPHHCDRHLGICGAGRESCQIPKWSDNSQHKSRGFERSWNLFLVVFLAATKQLYEWYFLSVCPSVTPFWLCSHHRFIMKFSGVITKDQGKVHGKDQGQRSKVKVTEVTTQLNRFRTVTPVWIHTWWWNATYSLMLLRRGALLFFKVIRQISRSHSAKDCRIWPRLGDSGL